MATVRVHYYRGIAELPKTVQTQFSGDSTFVLDEPREPSGGRFTITAQQTLDAAPSKTRFARIEVDENQKVRYEVVNAASQTIASDDSPSIVGVALIRLSGGEQLSLIEAT